MRTVKAIPLACVLGFLLILAAVPAGAGSLTVFVAPSGGDDTAALQAALDQCVAHGAGCTVQLAAGTFKTKQLVAYNFKGTFKGHGKTLTTLEALPELEVLSGDRDWPTPQNPPPSLLTFINGNVTVSDLSVRIPHVPSTKPWYLTAWDIWFSMLIDGIRFTGSEIGTMTASVDRISVEGAPDPDPVTGFFGYNVANGVTIAGELAVQGGDGFLPFGGIFTVAASDFRSVFSAVYPTELRDSRITFGGSPKDGNVMQDVAVGFDMESLENTAVEVSHNVVAAGYAGLYVIPHWYYVPQRPSYFFLHHNQIQPVGANAFGASADGIYLQDETGTKWIQAVISHNKVAAGENVYGGVNMLHTAGTMVSNNHFTGAGTAAILARGTTAGCLVQGNNVQHFEATLAAIYLGKYSHDCTVVGGSNKTNVMNLGTNNTVVGVNNMQGNSPGAALAEAQESRQELIRKIRKPF